jgi:hypothetical protein
MKFMRLVLLAAAGVWWCFCAGGKARGDDNRTLTVDPYHTGWKVTVAVPQGWAGKVARVKRPRLEDADVYAVSSTHTYGWDAPPGDAVYPPGPGGSPVALLWMPAKGKPVCVLALGFFRVREDDAKGKIPAPPPGRVVKFQGKQGAGYYTALPIAAGKIREPGFGRVEAVKEARGVYYVKQWTVSFDVLVRDDKSAEEFAQALKIVQEGIHVPFIIRTKTTEKVTYDE